MAPRLGHRAGCRRNWRRGWVNKNPSSFILGNSNKTHKSIRQADSLLTMSHFPNSEQQRIIQHIAGAIQVLAPAGTGKTAVMAERLAQSANQGIDLNRTLCVTFTNRAASEMRTRVEARLGRDEARHANIRTFHGLCAWILKIEACDLGLSRDFIIYDEDDCKGVLASCLKNSPTKPQDAFYLFSEIKSNFPSRALHLSDIPPPPSNLQPALKPIWIRYHEILTTRNAIDFTDLILKIRTMFRHLPEKRKKWGNRFDWIQIDEIQDTHLSEYEVISILAKRSGNLAFFGDLDQTIYEWRGSAPDAMLKQFQNDFDPVRSFSLQENYRATKQLLKAADQLASTFLHRHTQITPAPDLAVGESVKMHRASSTDAEAQWIARQIRKLKAQGDTTERIGVLARTHARCLAVSHALTDTGIDHITVEQYQFFLRQEIKDVLARLRLLLNPDDTGSLMRIIRRPASGIGDATLRSLAQEGDTCGLRLPDLFRPETHSGGEPFSHLLTALNDGVVVVLDVETTGLSPHVDEVIDIGAVRLENGIETERFDRLLRPSLPVGDSENVHGLSDALLIQDGLDPSETLRDFRDFMGDSLVVGHNVRFDLSMLKAHGSRVGVDFQFPSWNDTLDIARRVLSLERYTLEVICEHLQTKNRGSHRAITDTVATAEVLMALRPALTKDSSRRRDLIKKHGKHFQTLSKPFEIWRGAMNKIRPSELLRQVIEESGLSDFYANEPGRTRHLNILWQFFHDHDRPETVPLDALEELVAKSALARNIDHLATDDTRIPIITVHQAKGLEFDTVFIAGASEGEFPSYFAVKDNDPQKIEEERRLFYVALTRAKKRLFISSFAENDRGYSTNPSRFLRTLS